MEENKIKIKNKRVHNDKTGYESSTLCDGLEKELRFKGANRGLLSHFKVRQMSNDKPKINKNGQEMGRLGQITKNQHEKIGKFFSRCVVRDPAPLMSWSKRLLNQPEYFGVLQ